MGELLGILVGMVGSCFVLFLILLGAMFSVMFPAPPVGGNRSSSRDE